MGNCSSAPRPEKFYSVQIGESKEGETRVIANPKHLTNYIKSPDPSLRTLIDIYLKSFHEFSSKPCFGTRHGNEYQWKTYEEIYHLSRCFGSGVMNLQLCPQEHHDGYQVRFISLYSKNREEWEIASIGCSLYGIITVPLYETLGPTSTEFILLQTELKTIVLSNDKIENILALKAENKTGCLANVIAMDEVDEEQRKSAQTLGINLFSFKEIIKNGENNLLDHIAASPDDMYTLIYTSGTTGNPKGVISTHLNSLSVMFSAFEIFLPVSTDVHISFLPLAHVMERNMINTMICIGGSTGFYSGDILKIREDISLVRPTLLLCVPRLLTRFYDLIMMNFNSQTGNKAKFIQTALSVKVENIQRTGICTHTIYDTLVFSKTKQLIGGRVRLIGTGSAPISQDVMSVLRAVFCCPIVESYGQTETTGGVITTFTDETGAGHIGGPVGAVSIKLVDVPEMHYTSHDCNEVMEPSPRGEICFKGPCVMPKYFKNIEANSEAFDSHGWLHSGDIGRLKPDGSIQIIDRKKNIFKLSQGEYVAPEKIENIYTKSQFVAQAFVHGDSFKEFCVAVIVPDQLVLEKFANSIGICEDWESICKKKEILEVVLADITKIGLEAGLLKFEQVKKIHLHPELLTPDNGLLTPTMKLKRFETREYFQGVINALYL